MGRAEVGVVRAREEVEVEVERSEGDSSTTDLDYLGVWGFEGEVAQRIHLTYEFLMDD